MTWSAAAASCCGCCSAGASSGNWMPTTPGESPGPRSCPSFTATDQQPDAVASVRAWCAGLHDALDQQDALASSGALSHLHVPVSIIWGEKDRYLSPSLAAEIAALIPNPAVHLLPGAGHWPQHDQPDTVAELLKEPQTA